MRALEILHDQLGESMAFMHKARWKALWKAVLALIRGRQLWLTGLGRAWPGEVYRKHAIKAADRLLGNLCLYCERIRVYSAIAEFAIRNCDRPILLVDTTEIRPGKVALTAALAFDGRSTPIYSMVVPQAKPKIRDCRRFLKNLKDVLADDCRPILVSDAGFESPWFDEVEEMGWHYVGRVRNATKFLVGGKWLCSEEIHRMAKNKPKNLGPVAFPRHAPLRRRMVLSKKPNSGHRQRMTSKGKPGQRKDDKHHRKTANEPWLLATSLTSTPSAIVSLYAYRMQIEETFRDKKNHRWGWSFEDTRSRSTERFELFLLIASLAYLVQLVIGIAGERKRLQRRHQANTERRRRVISFFVLGGLLVNSMNREPLTSSDVRGAVAMLRNSAKQKGNRLGRKL